MERRPETFHLDQDRRADPELNRKTYATSQRRSTLGGADRCELGAVGLRRRGEFVAGRRSRSVAGTGPDNQRASPPGPLDLIAPSVLIKLMGRAIALE